MYRLGSYFCCYRSYLSKFVSISSWFRSIRLESNFVRAPPSSAFAAADWRKADKRRRLAAALAARGGELNQANEVPFLSKRRDGRTHLTHLSMQYFPHGTSWFTLYSEATRKRDGFSGFWNQGEYCDHMWLYQTHGLLTRCCANCSVLALLYPAETKKDHVESWR